MLRIRIVTGGAIFGFLLVSGLSAGETSAQTAGNETRRQADPAAATPPADRSKDGAARANPPPSPLPRPGWRCKGRNHWHPRMPPESGRTRSRRSPRRRNKQRLAAGVWPAAPSIAPAEVAAAQAMPHARVRARRDLAPPNSSPPELRSARRRTGRCERRRPRRQRCQRRAQGGTANASLSRALRHINEAAAPAPKSDSIQAATAQSAAEQRGRQRLLDPAGARGARWGGRGRFRRLVSDRLGATADVWVGGKR